MGWSHFSGKSIGLLGAGKENLSLIRHLLKVKARITICDRLGTEFKDKSVKVVSGDDYLGDLSVFDFVFRSPGLPTAEVRDALSSLDKKPVVTSATDLLLQMKARQVVGVTGTKGKGTTSTMITNILEASGKDVILAGNIGNSIFEEWDRINDETVIVMELSSFQLEDVTASPHIAVLLPISPDHLQPLSERSPNFHLSLKDYILAKRNICHFQSGDDVVVFSVDSQPSEQVGLSAPARKVSVSAKKQADIYVRDGILHINSESLDLVNEAGLKGDHVIHNAAVACAAASQLGADIKSMEVGLRSFKSLPHRMQELGTFKGLLFVNDSYATNPSATIAALSAYKDKPVTLILGGSSKGSNFDELAQAISTSSVKMAVLIGQEAEKIARSLKSYAPSIKTLSGFSSFNDAIETTIHHSQSGDVVLLSPACASKDMFSSAADRGDKFIKAVHELV